MAQEAKEKLEQKVRDELLQPYIFRDTNLSIAENCLIFDDFYRRIWQQLSVISLSTSIQNLCGPSPQEQLNETHFCQEGDIVCRDQEQREMMVSRSVREQDMEVWNGKIDNINESFRRRDEMDSNGPMPIQ